MCFSAPASFIAAGVAGAAGLIAVARSRDKAELPLASMPVFFGVQQVIEGVLWLTLPVAPQGPVATALTDTFLLFALVFWPVFAPYAVLSIETDRRRRIWIGACLAAGMAVALYFLWSLLDQPQTASIIDHHIVYSGDPNLPEYVRLFYPLATCLAPALSSHRILRMLALFIFMGSIAAYLSFWQSFTSVWCYFAAAASAVIVLHFERERRRAAAPQPAD